MATTWDHGRVNLVAPGRPSLMTAATRITVAGSVAGRGIKRASVGEITAVAADAKEGVIEEANAEAAADALIVRFGAKFETWDPNLKARRLPARSQLSLPIGPVHLPVGSFSSSQTNTYVRSFVLFGLQRPSWKIKMT